MGFQFQSTGSVTPFIVADLDIDDTRVGTLVGLFMIPGLVLAIPSGFIGSAFLPVLGGQAKDRTGTAAASLLLGTAMFAACTALLGVFRLEQKRLPIAAGDG